MGSGKSTIGRFLSRRLGKPFIDLDSEIEQSAGKTISEIFENDGEEY
ncbi:MAG: shikimate kinase, partial [Candidatus Neomarinimicrobiota bacterium]|nr:shikimate kinase [Candidatus Neomarinimicrobiota bacterium]